MLKNRERFKYFDITLLGVYLTMVILGIFVIYSASYTPGQGSYNYYIRQIYWCVISILIFLFFSFLNYRILIKYAYFLYILGMLFLVYVLIMGHISMGAQRWINLGGFKFQPSEIFKVIWIIMLARIFNDFEKDRLNFVKIVKKSLLMLPPFLLIFLQPDLGTAGLFILTWGFVLLFRGINIRTLIVLFVIGFAGIFLIWENLHDYQRQRVITFVNPAADPFGSGYHIIQSKVAIGSGGFFGKGYLKGTQSQLNFLPEKHTDFVFSVLCEEFGFLGGASIVFLFLLLLYRISQVAIVAREVNGKLLCMSCINLIFLQSFINSAMTIGFMPVVGIPMPFISYGGSSLMTFSALLGIINSISINRFRRPTVD
jgi:rod shape determining protein RodA